MRHATLPEAALRLGVSQSALRRRVRAGTAQGERRPSAGGFTWFVAVPDAAPTPEATPEQPTPTPDIQPGVAQPNRAVHIDPAEFAASQEAVRRPEVHVTSRTDELAARRREVQALHVTLNRIMLALPPPASAETHGQAGHADAPQAEPWPERRPWYRRLVWG